MMTRLEYVVIITALVRLSSVWAEETDRYSKRKSQIEQGIQATEHFVGTDRENETSATSVRMANWQVPGMSLAVMDNGRMEWTAGYGHVTPGGAAVDEHTRFHMGDISEMITAAIIFKMVENGNLHLDKDVNSYLNSWERPITDLSENSTMTIGKLLNQIWGLPPECHRVRKRNRDGPLPTVGRVSEVTPAGNSRESLMMLQKMLEDIKGTSFAILGQDFMRHDVLKGMPDTSYQYSNTADNVARGHSCTGRDAAEVKEPLNGFQGSASMGLWTTSKDMLYFISHLVLSMPGEAETQSGLGHEISSKDHMIGPGSRFVNIGNISVFYHFGGSDGYCYLLLGTADGRGVSVLVNQDCAFGSYLISEVFRAVIDKYDWYDIQMHGDSFLEVLTQRVPVQIPTKDNPGIKGIYILPNANSLAAILGSNVSGCIERDDGRLEIVVTSSKIQVGDSCSLPYFPCAYREDRFCPLLKKYGPASSSTFTFARDAENNRSVTAMVWYLPNGSKVVAEKSEYANRHKIKIAMVATSLTLILVLASIVIIVVMKKLLLQSRSPRIPRRTRRREYIPFDDPNDLLF